MILTLIQTASNRRPELVRFIQSLIHQGEIITKNVQYIFLDQGDNSDLFEDLKGIVDFKYVKIERCSLSKARNIAMQYVKGDVICFPDDDCWYPPNMLAHVFDNFGKYDVSGFTGRVTNENNVNYNNYPTSSQFLSVRNLCGASSICMFLKYDSSILFDENIGVGSPYGIGSGEESDYLIRYIKNNNKVLYLETIVMYHPINALNKTRDYLIKSRQYAVGAGYIAKKNNLGLLYIVNLILRPLLGSIINLSKGNLYGSRRSVNILIGRFIGLTMKIKK